MPAHQRHPAPHQQLLALALEARVAGLSFEAFFDRAVPPIQLVTRERKNPRTGKKEKYVAKEPKDSLPQVGRAASPPPGTLLWPRDTDDRKVAWLAARDAREGWQRAYEGLPPTRAEAALVLLSPVLSQLDGSAFGAGIDSEPARDAAAA